MSGRMRSTPGRSSPAKATPRSTTSHLPAVLVAEAVEREIHADLADAAERREDQLVAWAAPSRAPITGPACGGGGNEHVAGGDGLRVVPSGGAARRPPAASSASKRPAILASARRTRIALAEAGGARRASRRASAAKPRRRPIAQAAPSIVARERGEQRFGRDLRAAGREIGRRIGRCRPDGCAQLTPMPTTAATPSPAPRLRAGCRRTSRRRRSRSFGHLSEQRPRAPAATSTTASWTASAATKDKLRRQCSGGAGIGQQQARVEIAGLARPRSGRAGRGPRSAGRAGSRAGRARRPRQRQRLGVGRVERLVAR